MKIKDLINELKKFPQNEEIVIDGGIDYDTKRDVVSRAFGVSFIRVNFNGHYMDSRGYIVEQDRHKLNTDQTVYLLKGV